MPSPHPFAPTGSRRRAWAGQVGLALLFAAAGAAPAAPAESPLLARGRYLVEGPAACGQCHAPRDEQGRPMPERGLVGGFTWHLPTSTLRAGNITPDVDTGIGGWTDDQLARAIREGVRPDGRPLALMPVAFYRQLSDADLAAIVAWLRAQPARRHEVPPSEFRETPPRPSGPPIVGPVSAPPRDDLVRWGAYLAGPVAHCLSCHTPRDADGRLDMAQAGAGGNRYPGPLGVAVSRNLTPDPSGLKDWSDAEIERAIREGVRRDGTPMLPPMDYASYRKIDAHDMRALIAYLRSLPPRPFGGAPAAPPRALAPADDDTLRVASIEDLKRAYLQCNDATLGGRLGSPGVMGCSVIYETLKQRAFGGDFERLREWSRDQPVAREAMR